MLNFIARAFKKIFTLCLWLNLVFFIVLGAIAARRIDTLYAVTTVFGAIIGCLAGLLFNILFGGIVTVFLRIDKNLQILVKARKGQPAERGIEPDNE